MLDILTRAGCFIAVIILGYVLRRTGFFDEHAFPVLSKIVIRITLPGAIVYSFSGKQIDPSLLAIALLGLGGGLAYMLLGYLLNIRRGRERAAFGLLNTAGYNIGNFTMPFVQSFLGPMGIVTTSLFDVGNSLVCLGGAFSLASMVQEGGKFSPARMLKTMVRSVPLMTYVIMLILCLTGIRLPSPVVSLAELISGANAFAAMLMIGVGFKLEANRSQIGRILQILLVRYGAAALIALACWYLLPFEEAVRQALVILPFSPIASAAPGFTGELNNDVGLASAVNSISILCSIVIIVTLLVVMM